MKIECENKKLKQAVSSTEKISGQNLPLPVLGAIVFRVSDGEIKLQATNIEISIEYKIDGVIKKEGDCAIPASLLLRFIQNIPDNEKVSIEISGNNANVKTKTTSAIIKTIPLDDFPTLPVSGENNDGSFDVYVDVFTGAIKDVQYSASHSEIKPEIASVYIQKTDDGIIFTSTDSFRAAEKRISDRELSDITGEIDSFIVPIKNINDIVRVFENFEDKIKVSVYGKQLMISNKNVHLVSRLIDGVFPDVSQVFPKKRLTDVVLLKEELVQALKTINVFSDKFNKVGFKIIPKEKVFEVYARNQDTGESVSNIDGTLEGEEVDMKFNARYIMDVFQSLKKDSINLRFNGKDKPVVFQSIGDNSFTYLVMPMNT